MTSKQELELYAQFEAEAKERASRVREERGAQETVDEKFANRLMRAAGYKIERDQADD